MWQSYGTLLEQAPLAKQQYTVLSTQLVCSGLRQWSIHVWQNGGETFTLDFRRERTYWIVFKDIVRTALWTQTISVIKTKLLMLYRGICCLFYKEIHEDVWVIFLSDHSRAAEHCLGIPTRSRLVRATLNSTRWKELAATEGRSKSSRTSGKGKCNWAGISRLPGRQIELWSWMFLSSDWWLRFSVIFLSRKGMPGNRPNLNMGHGSDRPHPIPVTEASRVCLHHQVAKTFICQTRPSKSWLKPQEAK